MKFKWLILLALQLLFIIKATCISNGCYGVFCSECNKKTAYSPEVNKSSVKNVYLTRISTSSMCNHFLKDTFDESFKQFANLHSLDISNLGIFSFKYGSSINIRQLNASHNQLKHCDLRNLPQLTSADISFNKFRIISPEYFIPSSSLITLDLSSNEMETIGNGTFSSLTSLQVLDLRNNYISSFNQDLAPNKNLKRLDLRNNWLFYFKFSIFSPDAGSIKVNLAENDLFELDIRCSYQNCHFDHLDDDAFFKKLGQFNASGNHLSNIPKLLQKIGSKLTKLDLSINNIEKVEKNMFNRFNQLQYLYLSHSNISDIATDSFLSQTQLIILDLSHNNLTKIGENIFPKVLNLAELNLEGNKLMNIDGLTAIKFTKMMKLTLNNNLIDCQVLLNFSKIIKNVKLIRGHHLEANNVNGVNCKRKENHVDEKSTKTTSFEISTTTTEVYHINYTTPPTPSGVHLTSETIVASTEISNFDEAISTFNWTSFEFVAGIVCTVFGVCIVLIFLCICSKINKAMKSNVHVNPDYELESPSYTAPGEGIYDNVDDIYSQYEFEGSEMDSDEVIYENVNNTFSPEYEIEPINNVIYMNVDINLIINKQ